MLGEPIGQPGIQRYRAHLLAHLLKTASLSSLLKKEKLKPKLLKNVLVDVGMFTYDYTAA